MKKFGLLLFVLVFIFSCNTLALDTGDHQTGPDPILTLHVAIIQSSEPNVEYIAQLSNFSGCTSIPVITFNCNGNEFAKAQVDRTGKAIYRFSQKPGHYLVNALWLNTPSRIGLGYSNARCQDNQAGNSLYLPGNTSPGHK